MFSACRSSESPRRPSGEKNGAVSPSVPASGRRQKLSSWRKKVERFRSMTHHTSVRPSGEISRMWSRSRVGGLCSRASSALLGTVISVLRRAVAYGRRRRASSKEAWQQRAAERADHENRCQERCRC